ncbi:MAG: hypothetical protein R6V42_09275 [Orrella sp.]
MSTKTSPRPPLLAFDDARKQLLSQALPPQKKIRTSAFLANPYAHSTIIEPGQAVPCLALSDLHGQLR